MKNTIQTTIENTKSNHYTLKVNQQERIDTLVQAENYKFWLGGFAEGEGALVVSITKSDRVNNKIFLQPEFNVAQYENGLNILYSYKAMFNNLRQISKKSGSDKVWVYSLKETNNIKNFVIPFFQNYIIPYSYKYNEILFKDYCFIINKFIENNRKTMDREALINLVKLGYTLNPDGKGIHRKRTLEQVIEIINNASITQA